MVPKILFGTPPTPLAFAARSHTKGSGGASPPLCVARTMTRGDVGDVGVCLFFGGALPS